MLQMRYLFHSVFILCSIMSRRADANKMYQEEADETITGIDFFIQIQVALIYTIKYYLALLLIYIPTNNDEVIVFLS